ncbi:hypothetical protein FQN60_005913 [Etheostoma spectabile]|uniref:Uncharacterized protein n=1 Tax=Etheostoma spectabile TaxID=54343 RepID=A0A5J5CFH1_9PERO|nr:hypothetical protein FQN60_005913 [Etheostoma spectabile]
MEGRYTEGCLTAGDPHSGRGSVKLQDLKILFRQPWYIVILGGIGAAVGVRDEAFGVWPAVWRYTVFWAGRGRRHPSAQMDIPGSCCFDRFQLCLGGFEPAGSDFFARAGGCVGVMVGGGVALRLPSFPCNELWCRGVVEVDCFRCSFGISPDPLERASLLSALWWRIDFSSESRRDLLGGRLSRLRSGTGLGSLESFSIGDYPTTLSCHNLAVAVPGAGSSSFAFLSSVMDACSCSTTKSSSKKKSLDNVTCRNSTSSSMDSFIRCSVLFQFGHHLLEDAVVVILETYQLWEPGDKKP